VLDIGTTYVCECEGFKYYNKCRHIDKVKEMVRAERKKIFAEKQKQLL
jgi:glycine/serine hydroxymethyltransferase